MKLNTTLPYSIYAIRCVKNGKVYIGRSRDVQARMKQHTSELRHLAKNQPVKFQKPLVKDFAKFGREAFEVYILEGGIPQEKSREAERKWIKEYNATNSEYGYNVRAEEPATGFTEKEGLPENLSKKKE